jgi:hypothetical protein
MPDVPDKSSRPAAYDLRPERYQWCFCSIPKSVRRAGVELPNPFLSSSFYVVHGIGDQGMTETAAALRLGFEDAVERIDPRNWVPGAPDNWIVPEPFCYDGFWANYMNIEEIEPTIWNRLSAREREFFPRVWRPRAESTMRTVRWTLLTANILIPKSFVTGRWLATLYYLYLVPAMCVVILAMAIHPRSRKFIRSYLNDVRLYLSPYGDVEKEIVQRIDHLVGQRFLQMLGYDWHLNPLPRDQWIDISGESHRFERVTWVAHSLGSVISYNVIGDILRRCLEVRRNPARKTEDAQRVEDGLAAFVTLGSPLDKVRFLFGAARVLRKWPVEYLPGGAHSLWSRPGRDRDFWHNFHYNSDPVSGRLDSFRYGRKNLVANVHPAGLRLPGLSHMNYWRDVKVLSRVMDLTFNGFVKCGKKDLKVRPRWRQHVNAALSAVFWLLILTAAAAAAIYAGWWGLVHIVSILRGLILKA